MSKTHTPKAVLLFALLASWITAHAETGDDNTVHWYVIHWPPARILHGPDQGRGWADQRLKMIIDRTPTFRHEIVQASATRRQEDMKTKPNVCHTALLKTPEREAEIEFSEVFSWILPNGIITTRSRYQQFTDYLNADGELRLSDILSSGKRVAVVSGRRYGAPIDEAVRKHKDKPVVVEARESGSDAYGGVLLKLAHQDEYDMVPGYAVELTYLAREMGLNEQDFVFLPVAGQPPLLPTHIGCSKSSLGKRVITEINRLLADKRIRERETAAYRSWLGEPAAKYYDRVLERTLSGQHAKQ